MAVFFGSTRLIDNIQVDVGNPALKGGVLREPSHAPPAVQPRGAADAARERRRGLKAFCESVHPGDGRETLAEQFSVEDSWKVLQHTGIREQAAIFEYLPHDTQVAMVGGTGRERMAKLIEQMSHDDRVDLLRRLAPWSPRGCCGWWTRPTAATSPRWLGSGKHRRRAMTTDYAWLPASLTAAEAVERLRSRPRTAKRFITSSWTKQRGGGCWGSCRCATILAPHRGAARPDGNRYRVDCGPRRPERARTAAGQVRPDRAAGGGRGGPAGWDRDPDERDRRGAEEATEDMQRRPVSAR